LSYQNPGTSSGTDASCDATGARVKVSNIGSSGEDGVELSALPTSSSVAINTKGTGADKNRIASTTNPEAATILLEADLDGDGVMDNTCADSVGVGGVSRRLAVHNLGSSGQDGVEIKWAARPSGASFKAIQTKGTGASGMVRSCSGSADSAAARILLEADVDGDGIMDNASIDSVDASGATHRLEHHNIGSSGQDGVEVGLAALPSGASFRAINTKGVPGRKSRCIGSADSAAATMLLDVDTNGDGVPESSLRESSAPSVSEIVLAADVDGDGVPESSLRESSAPSVSEIVVTKLSVDRCKLSSNTGLTVRDGSSAMVCSADTAGNGYFSGTLAIGVLPASHHIDVAGGAYCDGTNWVNASDRNSKENFTAVDGNELLNQIAQLSITRWNYKGNNQAEHIGPTAQDFKAAFGVGADDKSISTIDPSGIALAAIKALNGKMQELNAKTTQLEYQAREITQLKTELDAIKVMLQKQTATKN
jgi:hypothetical protein